MNVPLHCLLYIVICNLVKSVPLTSLDECMGNMASSTGNDPNKPTSSLIVRFYRDGEKDSLGRTLAEMFEYDDANMERCHDHMQWLFPLHEPSRFASEYEILTGVEDSCARMRCAR